MDDTGWRIRYGRADKMVRGICWTKALSQEFWAGVVTPLMFSIAGGLIEERMASKGLRIAGLENLRNEPFLRLLGGEVYLNSRILWEIVGRIPSVPVTPEVLRLLPEGIQGDLSRVRVSLLSPGTLRILLRVVFFEKHWAPFTNYRAFEKAARRIVRVGKHYAGLRHGSELGPGSSPGRRPRAGGGGLLSHGSIMAREYGIPSLIHMVTWREHRQASEPGIDSSWTRVASVYGSSLSLYPLDNSE